MQVGALKALFERGIKPDLAVGTSAGALNATWIAYDPSSAGVQHLEETWRRLHDNDLFPGGRFRASWARMLVRGNRVFESSGLKKVIEATLGPDAQFEHAQIPLGVTATELETGAEALFTTGPLQEPLLASSAMPGIFPPVEIGGMTYIDGGVANNVPIGPAIEMGGKTLYVMDATSHSRQRRPLNRPIDYLLHAFALARGTRLGLDLASYKEKVRIVMLPIPELDFFVPFASLEYTARLIDLAYTHTLRFLAGHDEGRSIEAPGGSVELIAPASSGPGGE